MLELSSILKSKNIEFFLHFSDISDIREKIRHIPNIEVFYGKNVISRKMGIKFLKNCCYLDKVNVKYDVNITCTDSTSLSRGNYLTGSAHVEVYITCGYEVDNITAV